MNKKSLVLSFVALAMFSILSLFFIQGTISAEAVNCRNYFSNCTDGGCDAAPGWKAEGCIIRCGPAGSEEILCVVPQI